MPVPGGCGIMRFGTSLLWSTPRWEKRRSWMSSPQWRFADFRLDPDNACLWRGTQAIALTPKAFDVLHYLVTHPDRLVMKDTLLDAVWPETAVSDVVVRVAIGELRRALGDTAQAPASLPRCTGGAIVLWRLSRSTPRRCRACRPGAPCSASDAAGGTPGCDGVALFYRGRSLGPASSWRRSTAGSPRALTPPTSRRPRRCWTSWNKGNGRAWG